LIKEAIRKSVPKNTVIGRQSPWRSFMNLNVPHLFIHYIHPLAKYKL
jgi:hypothetical protein